MRTITVHTDGAGCLAAVGATTQGTLTSASLNHPCPSSGGRDRGFVLREDRGSRSYTVRKGNTFAQDLEVFFGATEGSCPAAFADTDAGAERARSITSPRVYEVLRALGTL